MGIRQKVILFIGLVLVAGVLFYMKFQVSERNQQVLAEQQSREDFLISQAQRYLDTYELQSDGKIKSVLYNLSGEVIVTLEIQSMELLNDKEKEEFKNITTTEIKWGLTNYGPFNATDEITVTFHE